MNKVPFFIQSVFKGYGRNPKKNRLFFGENEDTKWTFRN